LVLVAGVASLAGSLLYVRATARAPPPPQKLRSLESPHKTEEDWLLAEIVADLADIASFAADPGGQTHRSKVSIERDAAGAIVARIAPARGSPLGEPLRMEHSTWAAEDYQPLATLLIAGARVEPDPSAPSEDDALLRRLLDLRAEVIADENEAISGALKTRPADPRLHEDAAFLLGAFALRESAGFFSDTRRLLCRVTAHLSFARGLRASAPLGLSGRYAEALLAVLAERGVEAEAALGRLRAEAGWSEVREAWLRVLRMRASQDWRLLPRPAAASLAERLEWLRALYETLGCGQALSVLERSKVPLDAEADVAHILSRYPNVQVGNALLERGMAATLDEASRIKSRIHGRALTELSEPERIAALNEPQPLFLAAEGPRVIGWGTWAARSQRHLAFLLYSIGYHYRIMLALKDAADGVVSRASATFSKLTLFPIVSACWEADREKPAPEPLDTALSLVVRRPELITPDVWYGLEDKMARQRVPGERRPPRMATWFATGTVRGTTYDMRGRRPALYCCPGDVERIARLRTISPSDFHLNYAYVVFKYGHGATLADARSVFGRSEEYDLRVLRELGDVAYARRDPEIRKIHVRMCAIDAGECVVLGYTCVDGRDEACAVAAFERAFSDAADRVRVSVECNWLMKYHLRHGRRARAQEIARAVDEVGSGVGMETMSSFLEETGRYAEAERHLQDEAERYPGLDPNYVMIAFYHRMAHERGDAAYEAKFRKAAEGIFAATPERADRAALAEPPKDGALIASETPSLTLSGLRRGDVIVALDGWRVRDDRQYTAVRAFDDDPEMRFVVWRDDKYVEIAARRLGRRFGVRLRPYVPR
jgi:hypothetical protein